MRTLSLTLSSLALATALTAGACADAGDGSDKPATDPDLAMTAGKADDMSDFYTTVRGPLVLGEAIHESIDFPDYYLGRTFELRAGQSIEVKVASDRKSLVRIYGPATGAVDGQPTFGKAATKTETKKQGGKQVATLTYSATAAGTYMLLYGPKNVWKASYDVTATCVSGCLPADACASDDVCAADEFCGWNGVACLRAPCDMAYDICQARRDVGAGCARDGECADGLRCGGDGKCVGGTTAIGGACGVTADCANGFCGCVDGTCSGMVCKPFAAEGERCGGFRMPNLVTQCSPAFECVAPHGIIADIPGTCGKMTTVTELLADPRRFDGHFVAIRGYLEAGAPMCTKLACSQANPCCNACSANLAVFDDKAQAEGLRGVTVTQDGASLGCGGNECNWHDQCAVAPGNAWVSGWFHLEGGVTPTLAITSRWAF